MLNRKRLTTTMCGVLVAAIGSYSSAALALQQGLPGSVADLAPFAKINAMPAADLILATAKHSADDVADDVMVAALDSTGVPALPNFNRRDSGNRDYNVFGSVVVPVGTLPAAKGWSHALGPDVVNLFGMDCDEGCGSGLRRTLTKAARTAETMPTPEALNLINRAVNRNLGYRSDEAAWGKSDYWASPDEIMSKGVGDCEDFATTKLWLLRSIGFDDSQLQLVVLKDTRRQLYHAVLAVHVDGKAYILDNLSNTVANDTAFVSYVPIMSFVGGSNYLHGFKDRRTDVALGNMSAVLPGE